jgi:ATP adenylyltransferase
MTKTLFEKIYTDPEEKKHFLYDDGVFFAMLDSFPVSPGHSLIIPVRPILSIFDLDEKQFSSLCNILKSVKDGLESRDLEQDYIRIREKNISESSVLFCDKALASLQKNKEISGYNTGNNDGRSA